MRRRYDKAGILALYPQAFWDLFVEINEPVVSVVDGRAVVEIRGPLEHHDDWWCDSYEAILDRVTEACASEATTVILKLDSPGGELFGCFDAARAMRARCKAAGKRLVAYVEGCACSAAYALACSADEIVISETAFAGSIGILVTRVDVTARDQRDGIGFALVASGKRKVDGNPHARLTEEELASMQGQCDALAELFFELVASLRGIGTDAVRALEADVFHGPRAVEVGLADRVASFDELLELLAKGPVMENDEKEKDGEERETPSSSQKDVDDARAALERAAADGDENAQAALDVLNGEAEASDDDDDEKETEGKAAAARGPRRTATRSQRIEADSVTGVLATMSRRLAKIERRNEELERNTLLASRPDVGKEMTDYLATRPLADAKAILERMPKPTTPNKVDRAATAVVGGTRGASQTGNPPPPATPPTARSRDDEQFDEAFGRRSAESSNGIRREGTALIFDAESAARARVGANRRPVAVRGEEGKA